MLKKQAHPWQAFFLIVPRRGPPSLVAANRNSVDLCRKGEAIGQSHEAESQGWVAFLPMGIREAQYHGRASLMLLHYNDEQSNIIGCMCRVWDGGMDGWRWAHADVLGSSSSIMAILRSKQGTLSECNRPLRHGDGIICMSGRMHGPRTAGGETDGMPSLGRRIEPVLLVSRRIETEGFIASRQSAYAMRFFDALTPFPPPHSVFPTGDIVGRVDGKAEVVYFRHLFPTWPAVNMHGRRTCASAVFSIRDASIQHPSRLKLH